GWRAFIDEQRVQTKFANHAFIGVFVPRGTHRVRLDYLPESFTRGRAISLGTLAFLALAVAYRRTRSCPPSLSTRSSRSD
ncbi:MAG: YfhO family protein, partial [Thermoanaerobaculia bacterium]